MFLTIFDFIIALALLTLAFINFNFLGAGPAHRYDADRFSAYGKDRWPMLFGNPSNQQISRFVGCARRKDHPVCIFP